MKRSYRITRFDPARRDQWGTYPEDDWVSPSQVGKVFFGAPLTLTDYLKTETAYANAAVTIWQLAGCPPVHLEASKTKRLMYGTPAVVPATPEAVVESATDLGWKESLFD